MISVLTTLLVLAGSALKLGAPLLFDMSVFLVVVGFTLTIVLALERAQPRPSAARPNTALD